MSSIRRSSTRPRPSPGGDGAGRVSREPSVQISFPFDCGSSDHELEMLAAPSGEPTCPAPTVLDAGREMEITVHARTVRTWETFVAESPTHSIALDGYVFGRPRFDPQGPRANFNHHEEVSRLCTRSSCAQVFLALKQGLVRRFRDSSGIRIRAFVNDSDQDTCLALWLLQNHRRVLLSRHAAAIDRLVTVEDLLDTTAGAYPMDPASSVMRQLAWMFEPHVRVRTDGSLCRMGSSEMSGVVAEVLDRITAHVNGKGKELPLDTAYDVLGGGPGWQLVQEQGAYARTALYNNGTHAFVSAQTVPGDSREGTRYRYTLARMSPFVYFPVESMYGALNDIEGIPHGEPDSWGGSDTIGGSPRQRHSALAPERIEQVINAVLSSPDALNPPVDAAAGAYS